MSLKDVVAAVFAPDGVLSRTVDEYRPRPGQTDMALGVAKTLETGGSLVVEAGTGVGKTFSYLVPALLSGERVVVSTATKTLQDQLFNRDLPYLTQALGLPTQCALLKGRSSYLCLHRLENARHEASFTERPSLHALARIEAWSLLTKTGDLSELPGLDERSPLIPLVTSSRENCIGAQCPKFKACHVNQARREAMTADVVVINHHLFFADLSVRESGMAELLPSVRVVIFDEAHQLNETGVQFLGYRLGTSQMLDLIRDLLACGLQQARGLADWYQLAACLELAVRNLRLAVGRANFSVRLRWVGVAPESVDESTWVEALHAISEACEQALEDLTTVSELSPDFIRLHERTSNVLALIQSFSKPCKPEAVRWLEVGQQIRLIESPLDIASTMQTRLLQAGSDDGQKKSWIFTSATLGDDDSLSWFTEPCGLENASVMKVQSPFDYASQASLYIPRDMVLPGDPAHCDKVAKLVAQCAQVIGGRTLVLTTTLRALRMISESLLLHLQDRQELVVLTQGELPKRELLSRFRHGNATDGRGCILVASASFWEGVDIPGSALELVVIDKLPFPPPNDPLVEARSRRLELQGRSPFTDYFLPEAAVALKQGAGRLIRRETDQGVLIVCDSRLWQKAYGKRLIASLPPMQKIASDTDLKLALERLTKTSTMDRS